MARVYRATDLVLQRPVAVKIPTLDVLARTAGFGDDFRREARAAARLNHPNVVSIYDTGTDAGIAFIVMELVDGRTVADAVGDGPLLPERALEIAESVAAGLAFAHHAGVVHGDIKPSNIMLTRRGDAKVLDFGIARAVSDVRTFTSSVLATAAYLSPEQARGLPVDERSDVYSLGVVLFEMLAGRPPFEAETPQEVARAHVLRDPPPLSRVAPGVSPEVERVVMACLAKDPRQRIASAADLVAALRSARRAVGGTAAVPVAVSLPTEPPPPPRRRMAALVFTTFLVMTALLAVPIRRSAVPSPKEGPRVAADQHDGQRAGGARSIVGVGGGTRLDADADAADAWRSAEPVGVASPTPIVPLMPSPSPSSKATAVPVPQPQPSRRPEPSPSPSPSPTVVEDPEPTPTADPSPSPDPSPEPTPEPTPSPSPTATGGLPIPTPTISPPI